jgi:hypothetical protein
MIRFALVALLLASPAAAQSTLPSPESCEAVKQRVQVALGRADQGLQAQDDAAVAMWSAIAADYARVYETFCAGE